MGKQRKSEVEETNKNSIDEYEYQEVSESPELDECWQSSCLSQRHFKRSLGKGCLNKCLNDKAKRYSHVRELMRRTNLPAGSVLSWSERGSVTTSELIDNYLELSENTPLSQDFVVTRENNNNDAKTVKSMVIVEDISVPPRASQEIAQLSFTDEEFFSFLTSSEWGGPKMLRLMSGNLLQRLLTALYFLEAKGMIFACSNRAHINNGFWRMASPVGEEQAAENKPEEWVNEKVLVDMTHYAKSSKPPNCDDDPPSSNKQKQIPRGKTLSPITTTLPLKIPTSYNLYSTEKLKLPPGEDYNPETKIIRLRNELIDLKVKKEKELAEQQAVLTTKNAKDVKGNTTKDTQEEPIEKPTKGGKAVEKKASEIEDIAEDPYLVPEGSQASKKETTEGAATRKSQKVSIEILEKIQSQSKDDMEAEDGEVAGLQEEKLQSKQKVVTDAVDLKTDLKEDGVLDQETKIKDEGEIPADVNDTSPDLEEAEESRESGSVSSDHPSKVTSEIKKRLYLSGNELYVSGLYNERETNARPIGIRLHQANKSRLRQRYETAKNVYKEFYESRSHIDFGSRFKRLATAKEQARIKDTAPNVQALKSTKFRPNANNTQDQWTQYLNDNEEIEMRVATETDLEEGILKRILETKSAMPLVGSQEEIKDAKRGKKDKSKNNKYSNFNVSNNPNGTEAQSQNKNKLNTSLNSSMKTSKMKREQRVEGLDTRKLSNIGNRRAENRQPSQQASQLTNPRNTHDPCSIQNIPKGIIQKSVHFSSSVNSNSSTRDQPFLCDLTSAECKNNNRNIINSTKLPSLTSTSRTTRSSQLTNFEGLSSPISGITSANVSVKPNSTNVQLTINRNRNRNFNSNISISLTKTSGSQLAVDINQEGGSGLELEAIEETDEEHSILVPGPTESEILRQDLSRYRVECECCECADDKEPYLQNLLPTCRKSPFTYPVKLGHLKTSFRYLEELKSKQTVSQEVKVSRRNTEMGQECLQEEVFHLLDRIVVRKEIIVSSQGKSFTTIVFAK